MRLTKRMQADVADRVVSDVRRPREAALLRQENSLAIRLMKRRYGDDVFDRCRTLPAGWLPVRKQLSVSLGSRAPDGARNSHRYVHLSDYVAAPDSSKDGWGEFLDQHPDLYDEVYAWFAAHAELGVQLTNLRYQVRATLASYTTVEKLAEGWPEGYALLPQETLAETSGVPAPRIADLNARIASLREAA